MATEHICIVEVDIGTESEMKWQKKEHTHASTLTHPVPKLYIPSTINTWFMLWHTKWGLVCSKMVNHGLFSLPFKFLVKMLSKLD